VLIARKSEDPADARLLDLLGGGSLSDDASHAEALDLLRAHPAMAAARDYVATEAADAKRLLGVLPDGPVRTALEAFADVVADRSS
jgi:heptaprenyl diphosphate synthase